MEKSFNGQVILDEQHLHLKKRSAYHKILLADILYIQSDGDYTNIYTKQEAVFICSMRLKDLEILLAPKDFLKVHRSFLVNLQNVIALDLESQMVLLEGAKIPFSRRNKLKLMQSLPLS